MGKIIIGAAIVGLSAFGAVAPAQAAAPCTPTDVIRDGITLTAAQIGGDVTGTLDATGCNIGVYYGPDSTGLVGGADVSGANYFGVLVNHAHVDITNSQVHNIGEVPLNGTQHGNAVVYINGATGTISGSTVSKYQKNGITISGKDANNIAVESPATDVKILDNTVTGEGPIDYIAQNGIQVSYGATGLVRGNNVSGNYYTPASNEACGLLFYEAGNTVGNNALTKSNKVSDNETPLYMG